VIAAARQVDLSEEAGDVLDSLRSIGSATLATLAGDTGRPRAETARALHELETADLAEMRGGIWYLLRAGPAETASPPAAGLRDQEVSGCTPDRREPGATESDGEPAVLPDRTTATGPSDAEWGAWARARRHELGLSQVELARQIGTSSATVCAMEGGKGLERGYNVATWRPRFEAVLAVGGGMASEPDPPRSLPSGGTKSEREVAVSSSHSDQEARSRTATAGAAPTAGDLISPSVCPGGPGEPSTRAVVEPSVIGGAGHPAGGSSPPPDPAPQLRTGGEGREGGDPGWSIRKWRKPHLNAGLFNRCVAQQERIMLLEDESSAQCGRADDAEAELEGFDETLDRLGVPKGERGWRRGWLEGRLAQGGGR
jgi:hypothetical protein